eukprot:augustus_masked-scaffold_6-processed-gene-3.0-mRNA-1 protein AED:1.00 eAED:1.00 QI:0/-1/0/0/-1/1/1/0/306
MINKVSLVGGTHGNELIGKYLIKHFQNDKSLLSKYENQFSIITYLSNLNALETCQRYVDTDLNRCFSTADLKKKPTNYEEERAKEINLAIGPKGSELASDFVFDFHNTTADTGVLLCFSKDDRLALEVSSFIKKKHQDIKISFWTGNDSNDYPYLPSIGKSGMTVEVGPLAHGTFDFQMFQNTKKVIFTALDYLAALNENNISYTSCETEVLHRVAPVPFRRDSQGDITAFPNVPVPLIQEKSVPLLRDLNGNVLHVDLKEECGLTEDVWCQKLVPLFVNEAAYYEKDVAMFLAYKKMHTVKILNF